VTRAPAAIVGAALSDTGRVDVKNKFQLHQQASARAVADAGLEKSDIDGLASCATGVLAPVELAEYLGMRPDWIDGTQVGGASWEVMLEHAASAIETGHARNVLIVYGSTTRADLKTGKRRANLSFSTSGPMQFDAPFGHTVIAKYALATRRYLYESDTTLEQLAQIAVDSRWNASHNPDAYYQDELTLDEVANAPVIASPLTRYHCCIRSDGGGAVVVTSADQARELREDPVWILGSGSASNVSTMSEWDDFTVHPAKRAGDKAFRQAGLTRADVDICQFYDAFTSMVAMTYEALGFCDKGGAGDFLAGGTMRIDGSLPTNTDGGGLSACHPGMRGMFLLVEAVKQLRGEAGKRQVQGDPKIAVASGTGGWFSSASTVILGRHDTL